LRHGKVTIWRGPAESCKKNGAGVTSASKFLQNLEYKQDIKKRRETCKGRMWKEAFFNEKVCYPHQHCTNKTAFFNEAGSKQHLFILQDSAGPLEIVTFP
jgi:hypothetical protein